MQVVRLRPRFVVFGLLAAFAIGAQAPAALAVLDGGAAPPAAVDDTATVKSGQEALFNVLLNDSDPEGGGFELTVPLGSVETPHGQVACEFFGDCTYTSDPGFSGTDGFDYTIRDGDDETDIGHVTITVTPNAPPVAVDDEMQAVTAVEESIFVLDNDSDPDEGDFLEVTTPSPSAAHGTVSCETGGSCSYTSEAGFTGTDGFDYSISDGSGGTDTAHVTVTVTASDPPEANADAYARGDEAVLDVLANDFSADGSPLEITAVTPPAFGTATINQGDGEGNDTVAYSQTSNFGAVDSFTYTITDGSGGTDTATVTLDPCPAVASSLDHGGLVISERWATCSSLVANGTVGPTTTVLPPFNGTSLLMTSGDVAEAPGPNDSSGAGQNNHTEGRGAFDVSILRLDLNVPAGANCLSFDLAFQSEEFPEYVGQSFNDGFLAELDASTWSVSGANITAPLNFAFDPAGGLVSVNSAFFSPDRVITDTGAQYDGSTPLLTVRTPITPGPHVLYLSVFDASDHILDSAAFVDRLQAGAAGPGGCAAGANEPPNAVNDEIGFLEDVSAAIDVLVNDTDPDGHPLTITSASPTAQHGTVSCTAATCTYTPNTNYFGPDSFTYSISDGHGGTDSATVSITVSPQNDPPVGNPDSLTTAQDTPGSLNVLANDSDVDGPALVVSGQTHGANGTVACTPAGDCTYTPNPGFHGTDSFTYSISDGAGGAVDNILVSVTVTPAPTNQPPVASDDSLTTPEDTAKDINVLVNDSDPNPGDSLSVTSLSPTAAHGTVSCTPAGVCTYTPNANYNGSDSFDYTVSDGKGGTDTGHVEVTVTPVNDAPDAVNDSTSTPEDTAKVVSVLANDADVDGDTLTVTTASPTAQHGTVVCTAAGSCTYTPAANYHGPDSFTYAISDGHGGTDTATVNVTVTPVNDPPNAVDDTLTTAQDTAKDLNVFGNDTDDGAFQLSGYTQPAHGSAHCTIAGDCTYTPAAGYHGPDSFTYTIGDGEFEDTATVSITVTAANAPPSCANVKPSKTKLWPPRHQFVLITLSGATDPDGDPLTFSITKVTQDEKVRKAISQNDKGPDAQRVTGKPNQIKLRSERVASGNGRVYRIHYTVSDGQGGTCTGIEKVGVPKTKTGTAIDNVLRTFNSFG